MISKGNISRGSYEQLVSKVIIKLIGAKEYADL